jgi:uncharacterized protein (TIGR00645 family)
MKKFIETIIFSSKWLLIPFYLYLFWTLIYLMIHFVPDGHIGSETLMATLEAVDVVMIANLVKMIITGSYNSFVDKNHEEASEKVSSGLLKVKMSTSVMGVSSIHLLQSFISAEYLDWDTIWKQVLIHGVFIVGSGFLAWIDYLHEKSAKH